MIRITELPGGEKGFNDDVQLFQQIKIVTNWRTDDGNSMYALA